MGGGHSHGHGHGGGARPPVTPAAARFHRRLLLLVVLPIALLTLAGLVVLWPTGDVGSVEQSAAEQSLGTVVALEREPCTEELPEEVNGCGTVTVDLAEGPDAGRTVEAPLPNGVGAPELEVGDDVVVIGGESGAPGEGETFGVVDHQRGPELWVLVAASALALVAFGRWRGVSAIVGLAVTFGLLVLFVVPAVLAGEPPLLVAVVGAAAIMLTVLYLTHGPTLSTTVALLGTLVSLALTAGLSALAVGALHLTGVTDDLSSQVGSLLAVDVRGLLLAGIVIGALGVLDDVTVTQASTVAEVARANPSYSARQLHRAGMRVGRSHIASVVNTIVLAYAGSALPLVVLIAAASDPLGSVVTDQVVAQEVVRSLVATLGLVAAVPVTTALAAWTEARGAGRRTTGKRAAR